MELASRQPRQARGAEERRDLLAHDRGLVRKGLLVRRELERRRSRLGLGVQVERPLGPESCEDALRIARRHRPVQRGEASDSSKPVGERVVSFLPRKVLSRFVFLIFNKIRSF